MRHIERNGYGTANEATPWGAAEGGAVGGGAQTMHRGAVVRPARCYGVAVNGDGSCLNLFHSADRLVRDVRPYPSRSAVEAARSPTERGRLHHHPGEGLIPRREGVAGRRKEDERSWAYTQSQAEDEEPKKAAAIGTLSRTLLQPCLKERASLTLGGRVRKTWTICIGVAGLLLPTRFAATSMKVTSRKASVGTSDLFSFSGFAEVLTTPCEVGICNGEGLWALATFPYAARSRTPTIAMDANATGMEEDAEM